jgi:LysR family transcriptional regulator of abg operon
MRFQHLSLLLAIAETGSLRASAARLNVSQPALTKALQQLEEEFGAPLAVRTPRGVRLAPAGELLAARAATAMRELERAREEVAWLAGRVDARVAVGVSPVAAMLLAPGAVERVGARWPQVRLRVVDALYPEALARVRAGELDLAVGALPDGPHGRDLLVQPLIRSRSVIVARRGHPLARVRRLESLSEATWVLVGPAGGPGDPARLGLEDRGLPAPRTRLECESFWTLLALMPRLDIVGVMPQAFAERHAPGAGLVVLPIADPLPETAVHAAWRADAPLTLAAQHLLDALLHEASLVQGAMRGAVVASKGRRPAPVGGPRTQAPPGKAR